MVYFSILAFLLGFSLFVISVMKAERFQMMVSILLYVAAMIFFVAGGILASWAHVAA